MPEVQTVRGPVDSAELGATLMHEHIFVLTSDVQANFPGEWGDDDTRVADAVAKLRALYDTGVRTIVDPTVIGLGRYIPRIKRIAEQVPLNIVAATGIYTYKTCQRTSGTGGRRSTRPCPIRWWTCSSATSVTASPTPACGPGCSSAPSTSRGSPPVWSG